MTTETFGSFLASVEGLLTTARETGASTLSNTSRPPSLQRNRALKNQETTTLNPQPLNTKPQRSHAPKNPENPESLVPRNP